MATKTKAPKTTSTRSTPKRKTSSQKRDRAAHKPRKPFTVDHFRAYCGNLILDNGEPWRVEDFQLAVVEDLFAGAVAVWAVIPEGNGKTTFMGGLALYHADYTPSASVPMAASSRDQCKVLFDQAGGLIKRTPALQKRFKVFDGYRQIRASRTGGLIQVFAADERTGDGVIPTLALLEELHRQKDFRLYRLWRGKLDKRDGQLAGISTGGEPGSEFEEIRTKLRTEADEVVRTGAHIRAVTGDTVLHDWMVPLEGDVEDVAQVKAANPLAKITEDSLARKRADPAMTLAHWRRFVCNQPVRGIGTAVDEIEWELRRCDELIPEGAPVWAGLDLGFIWDTTAIVPLWMPDLEKRRFGVPEILAPPGDGSNLKPKEIKDAFLRLHERNPIKVVVMDMSGGFEIAEWLEDELGAEVVNHGQSNGPMCLAYERWMTALREGWLEHPGNPTFTQHVLNAIARLLPDGRTRFDRPAKSRGGGKQDVRVWDALAAASMVHSSAVGEREARENTSYRIELL